MRANGDSYEGEWAADQRHGHGRFVSLHGDVYEGGWVHGQRSGQGVSTVMPPDEVESARLKVSAQLPRTGASTCGAGRWWATVRMTNPCARRTQRFMGFIKPYSSSGSVDGEWAHCTRRYLTYEYRKAVGPSQSRSCPCRPARVRRAHVTLPFVCECVCRLLRVIHGCYEREHTRIHGSGNSVLELCVR